MKYLYFILLTVFVGCLPTPTPEKMKDRIIDLPPNTKLVTASQGYSWDQVVCVTKHMNELDSAETYEYTVTNSPAKFIIREHK